MRLRAWMVGFAVGGMGLALTSAPVRADAASDAINEARRHFQEGVKRYQEGDFEGARVLFRQADAEHHAPTIVYNIARAEDRLGHPQAAVEAYEAYIAEAGEKGELTQAAVVAIARVRSSARQLRIESRPPGARVFVDGMPTRDPAPTRVLVPMGRHHVVAEGEGWRAEADVEAGAASQVDVVLARPASVAATPAEPPAVVRTSPNPTPASPATAHDVSGFVLGGAFLLVPHRFDHTGERAGTAFGLAAGALVEAGFGPASDFAILGRAMFAVGSRGSPATTLSALGVAMTYRIAHTVWLGGAFLAGRAILPGAITPGPGEQQRFDSDYVFCPTLEVSVAVLTRPYGQWVVSLYPGYYFASPTDNDVFSLPVGFGLRTF